MDGIFYDNSEVFGGNNPLGEQTNENMIDEFLRRCDKLITDMNDAFLILSDKEFRADHEGVSVSYKTDIMHLDVSEHVKKFFQTIKELRKYRKDNINKDSLTDEEKEKLDKKYDAIVKGFIYFRNKQITIYNQKVNEINNRIEEIRRKLENQEISADLKLVFDSLETMDRCEELADNDLQKSRYLNSLDYKKLSVLYDNVSMIEEKLKIDKSASVDLWFLDNYIDKTIKELSKSLDHELDLTSITVISERMIYVYESLIEFDVLHELNRKKMYLSEFSQYSSKIVKLRSKFNKLEDKMFKKRESLGETAEEFKNYKFELQYLERKNTILGFKVNEYTGKGNSGVLTVLNKYSDKNNGKLDDIRSRITGANLEQGQTETLEDNVDNLEENIGVVNEEINNPQMLNNPSDIEFYTYRISSIDKLLDELESLVRKVEKPVTDKTLIQEIDGLIKERKSNVKHLERVLRSYKKANRILEFHILSEKLDKTSGRLYDICKEYRGKCPLKVKNVKSSKGFFKKFRKKALVSTGVSSMALSDKKVGPMLIPAIMHGNNVMGNKHKFLAGYSNFANNVLATFVGAKKTENGWVLSDGRLIDESIVTTRLLKALAVCGGALITLVSPVLLAIKGIDELMRKYALKEKHPKEKKENFGKRIDKLISEYRNSGMTLEMFFDSHRLTEEEMEIIKENVRTRGRYL